MKTLASAARSSALTLVTGIVLAGPSNADAPVFSPPPGSYHVTQQVTIASDTIGATILYSTNGAAPKCDKQRGTIYSGPITIDQTTNIKAVACDPQGAESSMAVGTWVIRPPAPVATPTFTPAAGTYLAAQSVSIATATSGATIRFTSDGSTASCASGSIYSGPFSVTVDTTFSAIACADNMPDSAVAGAVYLIRPPAAAPALSPPPGAYTGAQSVTLSSATPSASFRYTTDGTDPSCSVGTSYDGSIAVSNSLTLKAVACSPVNSDSPVTIGGYDITIPPAESVWKSFDFNSAPNFAAGSHSTNESADALNISGRGKVESQQQVFHYVYTQITGDFVMTARLDGVDFAGFTSNQGRTGLLLTPDMTATGNALIYGSSTYSAVPSFARSDRLASGSANANSNITVSGTGPRYLKLTRTGNTYMASASADGGATFVNGAVRTFAAGLPAQVYVGFQISSSSNTVPASATFGDVHIRDAAGNDLVPPNSFSGEIGSPTPGGSGGGPTTPPSGPSHPEDLSQGATSPEPALVSDAIRYNLEGFAAATTTGGGAIPDADPRYRKVTNATELVAALRAAKASTANPVKVIEIMNDLNLGWNEIGTLLQADGLLRQNIAPKKHPALIASGVGLLDIQDFSGLTIYSKNGATIRHAEFNIKNGTNLILRNLKFDELWEWDEATRGQYDSNDWDFVTIGDGGGVTSSIWVDHCTFTKSYDGVLDIKKGASKITISWSEVVPPATGAGSFVQAQFDDLEANRATNTMYSLLRGYFTQEQIIAIALPQKKGHLVGATNFEGLTSYTVTLHHNYYKDLQDRMPRLRSGDVHGFNLFIDSSNARIVRELRDGIVAANPALASALSSQYSFGIISQGGISTEGGAVQIDDSVFFGVLEPFRNNQTDVTNPAYTGAIRGSNLLHIVLASDTSFMPVTSQQQTFSDRGYVWASWRGDSDDPLSSLGPRQAPQIPFVWHNGGPTYLYGVDPVGTLGTLLTGPQGAGAGKIGLTTDEWLSVAN